MWRFLFQECLVQLLKLGQYILKIPRKRIWHWAVIYGCQCHCCGEICAVKPKFFHPAAQSPKGRDLAGLSEQAYIIC